MDKHAGESTKQSKQKDDTEETSPLFEPTIPEPLPDDTDPGDQSMHVEMEEMHLDESESSHINKNQEYQVEGVCDESTSTDVCQSEVELKDLEVTDLPEEKSHPHSVVIGETKTSIDNSNSNMSSSKTVNIQVESGPSTEVVNIPTHQAPDTSISSSNTISNTLVKCSEPVAIPSTSRDSSGLAPNQSSPKRPTDFGVNVKQAIHVFYPRNPMSILQRLPVPIHRGRWVYLRDSPESSDYGGSPDSLEDLFLMEALDVKTPENEMDDLYNPVNEVTPLCSPSLLNQIGVDSPSESGQVEGTIGDEPSESGHVEGSIKDEPYESGHIARNSGDEPSESGHIARSSGDEPSESGHIARTIGDEPSESSDRIEGSIADEQSESGHISGKVGDLPFTTGHIDGDTGDEPSESGHIEGRTGDEPSESGHIAGPTGDLSSKTGHFKGSAGDVLSEWGQGRSVNILIEKGPIERNIELPTESGHIGESFGHLHSELERCESSIGNLSSESGCIERGIVDLPSDSGQCDRSIEDLSSQSDNVDESNGGIASKPDHI